MADFVQLDSEHIKEYSYDKASRVLTLVFHLGGTYEYSDVPSNLVYAFANAPSKGAFFHGNIRGRFTFTKYEDV